VTAPEITPSLSVGTGAPLVLLHGLHASWRAWNPVIPHLQDRFAVFAPTLPGHRGAQVQPDPISVPTIADALEVILDEHGLSDAHLVGNSLGGWLALELARRGRARSVVAFSPAGSWTRDKDLDRLAKLMRRGRKAGDNKLAERLTRGPRMRKLAMRPASVRADLIPAEQWAGMLADVRACNALEGILAGIADHGPMKAPLAPESCPVRIVWPERDRTIPWERYGSSLMPHLPGADLVRLKGIGHIPMYDDPELVARTIADFVEPLTRGDS
jgi:pimeloyl-ACP methyl ester carboxylesterase